MSVKKAEKITYKENNKTKTYWKIGDLCFVRRRQRGEIFYNCEIVMEDIKREICTGCVVSPSCNKICDEFHKAGEHRGIILVKFVESDKRGKGKNKSWLSDEEVKLYGIK